MLSLLRRSKRVTEKRERKKKRSCGVGLRAVIVVVAVPIRSSCVHDFENVQKIIVERFPSDGVFCVCVVFWWFCWSMGHTNAVQMHR
jgi:hypothetical protein